MAVESPSLPVLQPENVKYRMAVDPPLLRVLQPEDMKTTSLSMTDYLSSMEPPTPQPLPAKAKPVAISGTPRPIAVGARSSKNVIELNHKCQVHHIPLPKFEYFGGQDEGWHAKATCAGEEIVEDGRYGNKNEAKEALCGRLLRTLNNKVESGEITKPEKKTKAQKKIAASVDGSGAQPTQQVEKEEFVNYTGLLLEFQNSTNSPQPACSDFQLGTSFFCNLRLESPVLDNSPKIFGSQETLSTSKKGARQLAAKEAIQHLKSLGVWTEPSDSLGGIKKRKKSVQDPALSPSSPTQQGGIAVPPAGADASEADPTGTNPASYAARVQSLSVQLGLGTPIWSYTTTPQAPNLNSVSCYFKDGGPHAGPLGEVRHILGKKKARDACARNVFAYLVKVREQRLEYGRKVMSGIGGEGLGEVLGCAIREEGESESEAWVSATEEDDLDSDEESVKGDV